MKVFEILKYFLTEKMDELTQQLFSDVQKEENQRMYVVWILFLRNSIHFFSSPPFFLQTYYGDISYEPVHVLGH